MHCKSYSHFCSKKFQHICVSLNVNFNESLTNDVVSFEQLGPGNYGSKKLHHEECLFVLQNRLSPIPSYLVKCDIETGEPLRNSNGFCIPVKVGRLYCTSYRLSSGPYFS